MAIMRWDPWGDLAALQQDMSELVSRTAPLGNRRSSLLPPIDAHRTDEGMVVRMELPGMRPEDVDVSVNDGVLTVSGERDTASDVKDDAWIRRERSYGSFERSFSLPGGTNPDAISADFTDGVLELVVPHPPERKPRKIDVGAGSASSETIDVQERQTG